MLLLVVYLSDWVSRLPMAALVAVMVMVSIGIFRRDSLRNLKRHPLSTNSVTVIVVVATHNLAYGVSVGVLLAAMFFAIKIGHYLHIGSELSASRERTYQVIGQVFFRSADRFMAAFDVKESLDKVIIDLSRAHFWDITAVAALDKVVFRRAGATVAVLGLNQASATLVGRFGVHDKPDAANHFMGH